MKEKKGFTLIELLAVIVVLAIIALIAMPMILGVIEKSRKSAFQDSVYNILEAAQIYAIDSIGIEQTLNIANDNEIEKLKLKGERPKGGMLYINKEGLMAISIYNDKYCAIKGWDGHLRVTKKDNSPCTLEKTVTLLVEEVSQIKNTNGYGNVSFTIDDISKNKILGCNKRVKATYENGQVLISNVTDNTICHVSTLDPLLKEVPDTQEEHTIILLDHINLDKEYLVVDGNKNIYLDFNGKHLKGIIESKQALLRIRNKAHMTIDDTKGGGGMIGNNLENLGYMLIANGDSAQLDILAGYFYSTSTQYDYIAIQNSGEHSHISFKGKKANHCSEAVEQYQIGICVYGKSAGVVKNNGSSNGIIDIYDGTFIGNSATIYQDSIRDSASIHIYGGDIISESGDTVVYSGTKDMVIHGGNFISKSGNAILNQGNGTIKICNGQIKGANASFLNTKIGSILYTNQVKIDGKIINEAGGKIEGNQTLVCS